MIQYLFGRTLTIIILDTWRTSAFGLVRILFGIVWAVDAYFKWQPSFVKGFSTYLMGALPSQPAPVRAWIGLWMDIVQIDPVFFAHLVALS